MSCTESRDGSSVSSSASNCKRRDAIIEIPIDVLKNEDIKTHHSTWHDFFTVFTWQQAFQIAVATATFIAGAGVGQEVLHDPLATAEGVLNAPVVVSQVAVIATNMWQLHHPDAPSTSPLLALIEHLTIFASAFALLAHIFLSLLFSLHNFPSCVEPISSYGGATLLHFLLILTHFIQAAVLKWNSIAAFLKTSLQRLCDRLYTWHPDSKMENALQLPDRRRDGPSDPEKQGHHHQQDHSDCIPHAHPESQHQHSFCNHGSTTGLSAILADIIAHAVSLPTFFTAYLLQTRGIHVNDLAVAWTVDISTLILLTCIMHGSTRAGIRAWKDIAGAHTPAHAPAGSDGGVASGGGRESGCGDLKPGVEVVAKELVR